VYKKKQIPQFNLTKHHYLMKMKLFLAHKLFLEAEIIKKCLMEIDLEQENY